MEEVKVWKIDSNDFITYFKSKEDLINYIKKNKSRIFYLLDIGGREEGAITTESASGFIEPNKKTIFFDETHIAFKGNYFPELCISKEFYNKNKEEIDKAFMDVMYGEEDVTISKYLYSDELIRNLVLTVNSITFEDGIEVPLEIKELLNNNGIEAYRTTDSGKTKLSNKKILGNEYETVISEQIPIYINENITDYENLKFIPSHKEIHIFSETLESKKCDNMFNIIKTLRDNGQENLVSFSFLDFSRKKFFESKLIYSNFSNVKVGNSTLEDLKRENDLLELMISDIKNSNYSPFEKYIAVYNIVKKFKEYKENKENDAESKYVSRILLNDYMVCAGYSLLLEELLYRVGINSYYHSVCVDTSYDEGFTMEEKLVEKEGHARLIVNINDPKYNIHGFYKADPTWDNDLEFDYYNYALIGSKKNEVERRYFYLENIDFLLNSETFEDFATNINLILDRFQKIYNMSCESNDSMSKTKSYVRVIKLILTLLKDLDSKKYIDLSRRYQEVSKENNNYNFDLANEFFTEVGHYFVGHYGKDIPIDTIIDAACVVNKDVFGFNDEQLKEYRKQLLEENIDRDKDYFPYYYNERYIK